jgi:SMC interacting uncharacterized protein involved in chromosome segregation
MLEQAQSIGDYTQGVTQKLLEDDLFKTLLYDYVTAIYMSVYTTDEHADEAFKQVIKEEYGRATTTFKDYIAHTFAQAAPLNLEQMKEKRTCPC